MSRRRKRRGAGPYGGWNYDAYHKPGYIWDNVTGRWFKDINYKIPGRRMPDFRGKWRHRHTTELKFLDGTVADDAENGGLIVQDSMCKIAQGITESARIGRVIHIKRLTIDFGGFLKSTSNGAQNGDVIRIIVFLDKQSNGAAPAVTDILETAVHNSFYNLANVPSRFKILHSKFITLNSLSGQGNGTAWTFERKTWRYRWNKKCNIPIHYDLTTAVIGALTANNVGILVISSGATATTLGFVWRMRFIDN